MNILLASSSPYRKSLLERLNLTFQQASPNIDESPRPGENAKKLALRLSKEKAQALADQYTDTLIIASDQCAALENTILGKPGTRESAIKQLSDCSGKQVIFHTGLCLLNTSTGQQQLACVDYTVWFRKLSSSQVTTYIDVESPLDCAGSFKCEGLGITLFEKMAGDDPNSLVGLPLIALTSMLINEGLHPLGISN
ncbi:Maf family protein [Endozoicomonas elysicola]|uniref:7-methyl-GTP pyrophosphatase n=1 Tax=Endozoicomonas elysicola TaxID=305900 RepID=A0A081KAZ8_9GAMM|nr:nucleoside triphosphate pyrophosphatase [Endozoicomonas elysicola]KEI71324.1 septum formation inhibitor Maf [Endozoicomonas elysicola]